MPILLDLQLNLMDCKVCSVDKALSRATPMAKFYFTIAMCFHGITPYFGRLH